MDPSYEDREQTEVKHKVLSRYLSALIPIVGDWASDIAYIDCLAGPWGEEQEEEVVRCYANKVLVVGKFEYVCSLPVMKPDLDAFHFHLVYGTRHIRGVEVFKETEKTVNRFMHETRARVQKRRRLERSGQYELLDPQAGYRERRFTRFQLRSVEAAKSQLRSALESSKQVRYEDAWATAMQYPGVMQTDFKDWLDEWHRAGHLIALENQLPHWPPTKRRGHYLIWQHK
jgi:hypothetical protein